MPLMSYCKKCKVEVPPQSLCPHCGGKLAKSAQRLSWMWERKPVADWFAWNGVLRIAIPVFLLVFIATVLAEAVADGAAGVILIFTQGFFWQMMQLLGVLLLATLLVLWLQKKETLYYIVDSKGVSRYTYLYQPNWLQIYAHFMSEQQIEELQKKLPQPTPEHAVCVQYCVLNWQDVERAKYWPETHTLLLYKPFWWQAICVHCKETEYAEVETMIRTKLSRKKRKTAKMKR